MGRRRERRFYIREAWVKAESKALLGLLKSFRGEFPVLNVSRRGICFQAGSPPKEGMNMTLLLDCPAEDEPFALKGTVSWVQRLRGLRLTYAVGVVFDKNIDAATEGRLVQLLSDPIRRLQARDTGWRRRPA